VNIGVISDTHGFFDESIASIFDGVDAIIHAGDIGKLEIIERLEAIAPVFAVRGNNDPSLILPEDRVEELAGRRIMIRHIFGELHQLKISDRKIVEQLRPDILVFGHSHRPYQQMLGKTMLFNPGSAGPRRFSLPRTVGMLTLNTFGAESQIITLD
jgi:putative phosphoesterase